jgi:L-galactose dehydrogenase
VDRTILGRTGLEVSVLGLGTGGHSRVGQRSGLSKAQSADLVRAALDLGINVVDTAQAYGTEDIVGDALQGVRDRAVLSTKIRLERQDSAASGEDLIDGAELRRRLEESLARLRTDRIDVLYLHGVRPGQYAHCRAELLPALQDLQRQGKVRFLGISESFGTDAAHEVLSDAVADGAWDVLMVGLNLVNHSALRSVLPAAARANLGMVCMYAVRGALADSAAAAKLVRVLVEQGEVDGQKVDGADPLNFLVEDGSARSLPEAAYRFAGHHAPGMHVVLTGTGRLAHLKANAAALSRGPLPASVVRRIHDIFGGVTTATGDPVE